MKAKILLTCKNTVPYSGEKLRAMPCCIRDLKINDQILCFSLLYERVVIAKWLLSQLLHFLASLLSRWVHVISVCEEIRRIYLCHFQSRVCKKIYFLHTFLKNPFPVWKQLITMLWKVKVQRDKIEGTWVYVSLHKIESPRDKEIDLYT